MRNSFKIELTTNPFCIKYAIALNKLHRGRKAKQFAGIEEKLRDSFLDLKSREMIL